MVYEVRRLGLLHHECGRAQDEAHVEVNILEHDIHDNEGTSQRRVGKQQNIIVGEEALLVTETGGESTDGRERGCGKEDRDDCLLCFSVVHTQRL